MRIRRVTYAARSSELDALNRECFPSDSKPEWQKYDIWLLLGDDDDPAGFAAGHMHSADEYRLDRCGITEIYQGRNLQRRLLQVRLRHAARHGATYVTTYTVGTNYPSASNLCDVGFRLYQPERRWAGKRHLYWRRSLG